MNRAIWSVCLGFATATPLVAQQLQPVRTLDGHEGIVTCLAISPDGKTVASGSEDKTIKIWDATTGNVELSLRAHSSRVTCLAFSPDGRTLASGSAAAIIKLWDLASGRNLATLVRHSDGVTVLAFTPDGNTLASASDDKTIKLWGVPGGTYKGTMDRHTCAVSFLAVSADGKMMALGDDYGTIRVWSPKSGKVVSLLTGYGVVFSPDSKTLASGDKDGAIRIWNPSNGTIRAALRSHTKRCKVVSYARDGSILASWGQDNRIRIWDVTTGKCRITITRHFVPYPSVALSSDGRILAAASRTKVLIWDLPATLPEVNDRLAEEHDLEATQFLEDDRDLVEQAFRQMIGEYGTAIDPCFLSLRSDGREAEFKIEDAFIARFKDLKRTVKKGSEWKANTGTKLSVSLVRWISNTRVELAVEFYWGGRAGRGYNCIFEFKDGKWRFEKGSKKNEWIS